MSAYWTCRGCGIEGCSADKPEPHRACINCGLENPWYVPGDEKTSGGAKHDHGKLLWHLLPWDAVAGVVRVLMHGAKIYAPGNWRKVENWRERYWNAAMRHLVDWHDAGVRTDADSGLPTLWHAACDVLFLAALEMVEAKSSTTKSLTSNEPLGEPRCIFVDEEGKRCTNRGVAEYDGFACAEHPLKRRGDSEV